jgi:pseudaminic acid cytidylyltransferase
MKSVCIIPARGGSKRIPKKNIRNFLGKPIIVYSIETALQSGLFESVIVSTDDAEIGAIANKYGAEVPFMRSLENSNDFASTDDVIKEVLMKLDGKGCNYDYVCCLYPTAPFISVIVLIESFNKMINEKHDAIFPVAKFNRPIQRALHIVNDQLKMISSENFLIRTQDLEPSYYDAGQFYWVSVKSFMGESTLFPKNTGAIVLDDKNVQDIDNESDWQLAELKYKINE